LLYTSTFCGGGYVTVEVRVGPDVTAAALCDGCAPGQGDVAFDDVAADVERGIRAVAVAGVGVALLGGAVQSALDEAVRGVSGVGDSGAGGCAGGVAVGAVVAERFGAEGRGVAAGVVRSVPAMAASTLQSDRRAQRR
jgi:hypothetical protein